jgi:hypothetical protein
MSYHEKDPRDIGYAALCVACIWYKELSADTAIRIAQGSSIAKPGRKLTPELWEEIKKVIESPNFASINSIVKRFRVNKYEVYEMVAEEKNRKSANKEVIMSDKVKQKLLWLKNYALDCEGHCEDCPLNIDINREAKTLCEVIQEYGETQENKVLQEFAINCNLSGDTKIRGFEIYKGVIELYEEYTRQHRDKKIRDMTSRALLEYMRKHNGQ